MNGKEIAEKLIALVNGGQCGVVGMRSLLSWLDDDNVVEFYDTIAESEFAQAVGDACASNGLIPHLAPGMHSPLELTPDQQEYAYPEEAAAFLSRQFGSMASSPYADKVAEAVVSSGVAPVPLNG